MPTRRPNRRLPLTGTKTRPTTFIRPTYLGDEKVHVFDYKDLLGYLKRTPKRLIKRTQRATLKQLLRMGFWVRRFSRPMKKALGVVG